MDSLRIKISEIDQWKLRYENVDRDATQLK